jgi:SPP1 gp7 family putative phage head morphogenesis protein
MQLQFVSTEMLPQVNTIARDWAEDRAAELVGMRYDEDGVLVPNPRAEWAISDSTRDEIRDLVKEAFEENASMSQFVSDIEDAGMFSEARAEMIARTEVSNAQAQGNFEVWKKSGVVTHVRWDVGDDDPCPRCLLNDGKERELGKPFPSGDIMPLVHPNCACVLIASGFKE